MVSHKPFLTATGFFAEIMYIITVEISYLSRILVYLISDINSSTT